MLTPSINSLLPNADVSTSDLKADTKQDLLQLLLKQSEATAHDLAEKLAISPQAIRRHLKDLEQEGLLTYRTEAVGMGRPQHFYQLTSKAREKFPDSYNQFAVNFLDTLIDTLGKDQVTYILEKQWQRKAENYRQQLGKGTLRERLIKLVELRRLEGYVTEYFPVEGTKDFIFTEYNCAIAQVAQTFPTVCGHELEMFAAVLDCPVERTHWLVDGEHRCGYLVQFCELGSIN
ncbi:MAG: iron-sulfur cluster biosynthesis transcriptional regulator SufR [Pseudanabaena sp. ELA607]